MRKAPNQPKQEPSVIDWPALRARIFAGLNLETEFAAIGVRWAGEMDSAGWRDCHAIGRDDLRPSACCNLRTGVYRDRSGGQIRNLLELAVEWKVAPTWIDAYKFYGERAGVEIPRPNKKADGTILETTHPYCNGQGKLIYQILRFRCSDGSKTFRTRAPEGDAWVWSIKGIDPIPYRLPELVRSEETEPVYILEGEKDVDKAFTFGLTATTNYGGTGNTRQWEILKDYLIERDIVIIPDNDPPGQVHATSVAMHLKPLARSVKVITLPGLPPKGDLSDWIDAGGTPDQLAAIVSATAIWEIPTAPPLVVPVTEQSATSLATDENPLEDDFDPHRLAKLYLKEQYCHPEGHTLRHYAGDFHGWNGQAWKPLHDHEVKFDLVTSIKTAHDQVALKTGKVARPVTTKSLSNTSMALSSLCLLKSSQAPSQPCWLGDKTGLPNPINLLPASNGLVDMTRVFTDTEHCLLPLTPRFFSPNNLGYDFLPQAPRPDAWLGFLESLWGDDPESIATLQEWFGYCLVPDTSLQKMLMLIGPKRSGKGTIARTLQNIVGYENTAAPTLASLGASNFGCSPLIGKNVAIFGDARISGRADTQAIVERLLSITGEDAQTIDRKHKDAWTGTLTTRFMLISNELPKLGDSSGALPSRFVILKTTETFIDREDHHLIGKLLVELPAILLWSIVGRERLKERGRFLQPKAAIEMVDQFDDLSSPCGAWFKDCLIPDPTFELTTDQLFANWLLWCKEQGRDHPGDKGTFCRMFASCAQNVVRRRTQRGGKNIVIYGGVKFRDIDDGSAF